MQQLKALFLGAFLLAPVAAHAQTLAVGPHQTQYTYLFQTPGAWSQVMPSDPYGGNVKVIINACGGGGAGGGGQASASTAGGSGGTSGACVANYVVYAASGATLSGTIGAGGTLSAAGSAGGNGSNTTITGFVGGGTFTAQPGNGGGAGTGGTGGASPGTAWSASAGGNTGAAAGANGSCAFANQINFNHTQMSPYQFDGCPGGGGGNTAGLPGGGGIYWLRNTTPVRTASNGAGGTGGDSYFSTGQLGSAAGVSCSSTPTWTGLGGAGGCGGGSNASSGPGQAGFVQLTVITN